MFVVMNAAASQAEANAVKSLILAEGLVPYDHVGAERLVIAVVGEIGARKPVLISRLEALGAIRWFNIHSCKATVESGRTNHVLASMMLV